MIPGFEEDSSDVIRVVDAGGGQGHATEGDNSIVNSIPLSHSWTSCSIESSCDEFVGEACLAGITSADGNTPPEQGELAACGSGTANICCCPSGSLFIAGQCVESENLVRIDTIADQGRSAPPGTEVYNHGTDFPRSIEFQTDWQFEFPLEYQVFIRNRGSSTLPTSGFEQDSRNGENTDVLLTDSVAAPSSIGQYEICAYARLNGDQSINDIACFDIEVRESCDTTTANAAGYDAGECSETPPTYPYPYTAQPFYECGSDTCYMFSCPIGSTYNGAICEETACTDGIDNDLDGLTDLDDPDCSGEDNAPVINSFTASPTSGPIVLDVDFDFDISDERGGMIYELNYGDGTSLGPFVAGGTTVAPGVITKSYNAIGTYTATLTVTDSKADFSSETTTQSITITVICPTGSTDSNDDGTCEETACTDGIDNDLDGLIDLDDTDVSCLTTDQDPTITFFTTTPATGPAPLSVDFAFEVADDRVPFNYSLTYGDATKLGPFIAGASPINPGVLTKAYATPGVYDATLQVNGTRADGSVQITQQTLQVSATNAVPVITVFSKDITDAPAPLPVTFNIQVSDDSQVLTNDLDFGNDYGGSFGSAETEQDITNQPHAAYQKTKTYLYPGTYTATLTSTDEFGQEELKSECKDKIVELKKLRIKLDKKLDEMEDAGEDTFEELRADAQLFLDDAKEGLKSISKAMRNK